MVSKSCQQNVKKWLKSCQKVVKNFIALSKINKKLTVRRRRRIGRRRRLVFPRPGADYVAPGKN
jgi:hypothetical protein